jgi:hypothetical protein
MKLLVEGVQANCHNIGKLLGGNIGKTEHAHGAIFGNANDSLLKPVLGIGAY